MDVRVFPFSFPPIRGGAQGGVSPTPTPDPTPDDPFDVDTLSVTTTFTAPSAGVDSSIWDKWYWTGSRSYAAIQIRLSDIVINDNSAVASIGVDYSDLVWSSNGSPVTPKSVSNVSQQNTPEYPNGYVELKCRVDSNINGTSISVAGDVVYTAYDANGDALQTWTVTVAIP